MHNVYIYTYIDTSIELTKTIIIGSLFSFLIWPGQIKRISNHHLYTSYIHPRSIRLAEKNIVIILFLDQNEFRCCYQRNFLFSQKYSMTTRNPLEVRDSHGMSRSVSIVLHWVISVESGYYLKQAEININHTFNFYCTNIFSPWSSISDFEIFRWLDAFPGPSPPIYRSSVNGLREAISNPVVVELKLDGNRTIRLHEASATYSWRKLFNAKPVTPASWLTKSHYQME